MQNMETDTIAESVLHFWFEETSPAQWYKTDLEFDTQIRARFGKLHQQITMGLGWDWRKSARGSLAEIIILDQFSRNMFRGTPQAFAHDPMAIALAQFAIDRGMDKQVLDKSMRSFFYMPFMHSEALQM